MNNVVKTIQETGVLPVLSVGQTESAVPLAKALRQGGVPLVEIVLRTSAALEVIANIKRECPDVLVGAGTILQLEQAHAALQAGADFLVSPDFNLELIQFCLGRNVAVVPGCTTPSELGTAQRLGLELVKFFPSEPSGGIDAIKLLSGPFPKLRFVPTGGITRENLSGYLRVPQIAACGGSFMAKANLIREGRWAEITENCRQAVMSSLGFSLAGLYIPLDEQGLGLPEGLVQAAQKAGVLFSKAEVPNGTKGGWDLRFYTSSLLRAGAYLDRQGIVYHSEKAPQIGECLWFNPPASGGRIWIQSMPS